MAAGGEDGPESKRAHRITQAYELAKFALSSAEKGRHVICVSFFGWILFSHSQMMLTSLLFTSYRPATLTAHPLHCQ
jgi:hypothetical protein